MTPIILCRYSSPAGMKSEWGYVQINDQDCAIAGLRASSAGFVHVICGPPRRPGVVLLHFCSTPGPDNCRQDYPEQAALSRAAKLRTSGTPICLSGLTCANFERLGSSRQETEASSICSRRPMSPCGVQGQKLTEAGVVKIPFQLHANPSRSVE